MKIIDIGICIANNDPLGLGRIRCVRNSDFVSEKEKADTYEPFSDNDIFVAIPFLPLNVNFVPEVGQAIKILNYNTEKDNVNQEYIAGPFTSSHNFPDQSYSSQLSETTYGVAIKRKPEIFDKNGNYKKKKSIGSLAKNSDYGIYGKYGSDVIFTENGLQLRGGKFLTKENAKPQDRDDIYSYPIMSNKSSVLTLKKFPNKMEIKPETNSVLVTEIKNINYLIEYNVVNNMGETTISSPFSVEFYVYKILKPYGDVTKTNNFNENSELPSTLLKLINIENDSTSPTHTAILPNDLIDDEDKWNKIIIEIKDFLYTLHENDLKTINSLYQSIDHHPFYFRPKTDLVTITGTTEQSLFKKNALSSIKLYSVGPKSGLIFSKSSVVPPVRMEKTTRNIVKVDSNSGEQTFSSLRSDKMYFLSTDPNKTEKSVPFENLDKYELTQSDYIEKIDPNTYSLVRGENLLRFLDKLIRVLFEHEHNVVGPFVKNEEFKSYTELLKLMETIKDDILNNSIRIN